MGTILTSYHSARIVRLEQNRNIDVLVLFPDVSGTLPALRAAAKLASGVADS